VLDLGAPSSQRAIFELEKPKVRERLHRIALTRTTSHAAADDLVEDALVRVLDPDDSPWDSGQYPFVRHMRFVMRQTWDRQMRRASVQREVLDEGVKGEEGTLAALEHEHPLVRPICELGAQGIASPSQQAQALGCPVQAVYDAFATLERHARKALTDWERDERRRMMMAQASATAPATETAEEKEVTA